MADGIQFEEEQQYQQPAQTEQKPFFIRLVLSTGVVSTDRQAEYVLLGVAVLGILITLFTLFSGGNSKPAVPSITGAPISSIP